jgi:hypothetical protein
MKYVRTLTLKESVERWPVVDYVKNSPQAQASLLAGVLALIGGGLKLAATANEFNSEAFMLKTDGDIVKIKCKKVPTIKCNL